MSLIHPSSLGVRLTLMNNFKPKATGDLGEEGQGDKGTRRITIPDSQSPIPKTQLLLYLIPVIGFFPSLWTLYRGQGSREQLSVSRLSITLAFTWLLGYLLLNTGAATSDFFSLRLFILNSFLTSGYFLVSVWLILRLMQGKSGRLSGFSTIAERVLGKYLS
ncbi:hypothetical protein [Nostoc sp. UHCC 0252]|uniref:hypothetical protein n=1 Tax=Nostoc sp. UHCC 0252 TaxID=3110241 RepID=UPI002B215E44|nr:hypothetical protein [Nostoc sp. UHCC 0252]MEA5601333.1 hypothetical protein [Nostoc sp. UHCC 0252]